MVQFPPIIVAIVLVEWKLKVPQKSLEDQPMSSNWDMMKRIDFLGGFFMSLTILTVLLVLDTGGQKYPWMHPIIILSSCLAVASGVAFYLVERYWATEPIFPLHLLTHYVVVTSYMILSLQNLAQSAVKLPKNLIDSSALKTWQLMFIIPIYFQGTMKASPGGAFLVPTILGNTVGGLMTGAWIKR